MSELKIKDGDATDKYLGTVGTGATGDPYHNIPALFELEVAKGNVVGHTPFQKYGKNPDVGTGGLEDIWNGGSLFTGFPTGAAETMEVFSSSANDTAAGTGARTLTIYNLLDDTGAEMPNITVTLNGTTPVSLGAGLYYRGGTRMKVITAGSTGANEGTLTLRHTTTTTNIFAVMPTLANQTAILAYTVPLGKTLYIKASFGMSRASGAAGSAVVSLRNRLFGTDTVFNSSVAPAITDDSKYRGNYYFKYLERTDVKGRADSVSDTSTIVTGEFEGYLIDN